MAGPTSGLTLDASSLATLKARAASDPKAAVKEAAKQFETLFMNELVKSMRASTLSSGMLENEGSSMGTEMLDTQLAGKLSGLPGGLADVIAKQLERQMGLTPGPIPATGSANNTPEPLSATPKATQIPQTGAAGFVQQHTAAAQAAEAQTGIPASFMVAQAAHETGWGRKEIRHPDGSPSYNLFGIKASGGWNGPTTDVTTTEYINGKAQKVVQRFRAYASYDESFADYAKMMKDSPRYAKLTQDVAAHSADGSRFARGLQRAGYATDPAYADKLTKMINQTLRLQRSVA
jgi:flagellar protein FlgJ